MHTRRYRVLDQIVEVSAQQKRWLSDVEISLARFPEPADSSEAALTIRADVNAIEAFDNHGTRIKRRILSPTDNAPWLFKAVTNQCLLSALSATHDVLHGSAFVANEKAHLFIGGSGAGKTTLTLELLQRDYSLLCEGQIPVSRETAMAQPFPRGLESERSSNDAEPPVSNHFKKSRPLEQDVHLAPCSVESVFFLEDVFPGTAMQKFLIACPANEQSTLMKALSSALVTNIDVEVDGGMLITHFRFQPTPEMDLNELHQKLQDSGVQVDLIRSAKVDKPQWSKPVKVEEVSLPKAALGLAANCFHHARVNESAGDVNMLHVFSKILKNARAYLLRHGNVDQRARCVIEKINQK